jgi:hypothetical protein
LERGGSCPGFFALRALRFLKFALTPRVLYLELPMKLPIWVVHG